MITTEKHKKLKQLAIDLFNSGLIVLIPKNIPKNNFSYFTFSDGKNIGYIQTSSLGSLFDYSKEYIPSKENGSAISVFINEDTDIAKANITLIAATSTNSYSESKVNKYKDIEHFLSKSTGSYKIASVEDLEQL